MFVLVCINVYLDKILAIGQYSDRVSYWQTKVYVYNAFFFFSFALLFWIGSFEFIEENIAKPNRKKLNSREFKSNLYVTIVSTVNIFMIHTCYLNAKGLNGNPFEKILIGIIIINFRDSSFFVCLFKLLDFVSLDFYWIIFF